MECTGKYYVIVLWSGADVIMHHREPCRIVWKVVEGEGKIKE